MTLAMARATHPDPRQRRYPARLMRFARSAFERGHTIGEIRAALAQKGYYPAYWTVVCWADPEHAKARRAKYRDAWRKGRTPRIKYWQRLLGRVDELRELRVSFRAIAAIMNHDFDLELDRNEVEGICKRTLSPKKIREKLTVKDAE